MGLMYLSENNSTKWKTVAKSVKQGSPSEASAVSLPQGQKPEPHDLGGLCQAQSTHSYRSETIRSPLAFPAAPTAPRHTSSERPDWLETGILGRPRLRKTETRG